MATTGILYPSTVVNDASIGSQAWTNVGNAGASDNSYATNSLGDAQISNYVKATNYGAAVPSDATVNGVILYSERKSDSGLNLDHSIRLVVANTIVGTNKAASIAWAAVEGTVAHGGAADLHGQVLTPAIVNASTFGWAIACLGNIAVSSLDSMGLEIIYTPASVPSTPSGFATVGVIGAGVDRILIVGIPAQTDLLAVGAGTNTACTIAMTADGNLNHYIGGIVWSYSGNPTGGRITVIDNANNTVLDEDVATSGPQQVRFPSPMCLAGGTTDGAVILAAGGNNVTGKVHATIWKLN